MSRSPDHAPGGLGRLWAQRLFDWFDRRYQIAGLIEFLRHKDVPITGMSFLYYFGGIALFLFVVQVVTGVLLLMYYVPSADQAYESVHNIMAKIHFGWLIRSLHAWSANLLILSVMIHLFSVFFLRAYRNPRELTWATGFGLLGLVFAFGFSGYLLPWNQRAFFATKVGTDILGQLPVVGTFLLTVLRGGEEVTGATLGRFFGLHVAILPGLATLLVGGHLLLIQRQGMSHPAAWLKQPPEQRRSMPFFPNFLARDLLLWFLILNAVAAVAVFWPAELGDKADPFGAAPAGIKPEWYFLSQYQVLKWMPARIGPISGERVGILAMMFAGLAVFLLPFCDRAVEGDPRRRWLDFFGVAAVTGLILLTVVGYVSQ
ncbi:MAG: cytochrome bc complex cytochrome b subunit [Candidatus Sumerlaeota bacterium]|nr:cytochrome bc complex cytochrome b subunit [Candidatus Sumerlaeota bacterium]